MRTVAVLRQTLPAGIQRERVQRLTPAALHSDPVTPLAGRYVLYWMQRSVRTEWNHALEYAIYLANTLQLPLCVLFVLTRGFPGATERSYTFLLEGLACVQQALARRGLRLVVRLASGNDVAAEVVQQAADAAVLVTDRGYTRVLRSWRTAVAAAVQCPMMQVRLHLTPSLNHTSTIMKLTLACTSIAMSSYASCNSEYLAVSPLYTKHRNTHVLHGALSAMSSS
jgi:deoxyribodipyrimidine photolyase